MNRATQELLPVPGPNVRREYLRLPGELSALTRGFGIALPLELQRDAAVLAFSIECADRFLDAIPQAARRAQFGAEVLSCLRGEPSANGNLMPELTGWLTELREVAERHGAGARFREIVGELLRNSEAMRLTRCHTRFVACALREGRLMVELLLLLLAKVSTPQFDSFMRRLSGPANLIDKLRDARRDFQNGEIAARPTWKFHARLIGELLMRIARLAPVSLVHWRLAHWGVHSVLSELICQSERGQPCPQVSCAG